MDAQVWDLEEAPSEMDATAPTAPGIPSRRRPPALPPPAPRPPPGAAGAARETGQAVTRGEMQPPPPPQRPPAIRSAGEPPRDTGQWQGRYDPDMSAQIWDRVGAPDGEEDTRRPLAGALPPPGGYRPLHGEFDAETPSELVIETRESRMFRARSVHSLASGPSLQSMLSAESQHDIHEEFFREIEQRRAALERACQQVAQIRELLENARRVPSPTPPPAPRGAPPTPGMSFPRSPYMSPHPPPRDVPVADLLGINHSPQTTHPLSPQRDVSPLGINHRSPQMMHPLTPREAPVGELLGINDRSAQYVHPSQQNGDLPGMRGRPPLGPPVFQQPEPPVQGLLGIGPQAQSALPVAPMPVLQPSPFHGEGFANDVRGVGNAGPPFAARSFPPTPSRRPVTFTVPHATHYPAPVTTGQLVDIEEEPTRGVKKVTSSELYQLVRFNCNPLLDENLFDSFAER